MDDDDQYFWCLTHHTVEQGPGCKAENRLGPYATVEAARNWQAKHEQREDSWEEDDEAWDGA